MVRIGTLAMYTESDQWLELAANFSIIASILVIIYFFVLTTWRIARLPNSPWPWGTAVHYQKEIHQRPTKMPFLFKLKHEAVVDRISFQLQCPENPSCIRVFWAVDATYLFKLINAPSWNLIQDLESSQGAANAAERNNGVYAFIDTLSVPVSAKDQLEKELTVGVPKDFDWSVLVNQYKYPAAVFFMKRLGSESEEAGVGEDSESRIVGLCVILHVKNTLIQKPTAVLAQYIKLANGQAHKLESLFVMDNDEKMDPQTSTSSIKPSVSESLPSHREEEPFDDVLCSVCQALPVSRAIIPCRHVCLCAICFSKVKICPICRGPISYFFKTRCENYVKSTNAPTEETRPSSWEETISNWNDGLNTAQGYRE